MYSLFSFMQRWLGTLSDILNHFQGSQFSFAEGNPTSPVFSLSSEDSQSPVPPLSPRTIITKESADTVLSKNDTVRDHSFNHRQISLPKELFFGNPQLPPNVNNHFIPLTLQQPTTVFAYSMSTKQYKMELEAMKRLVDEGGIEGCCSLEKYLLDQNDNLIRILLDVEDNGIPYKLACKIFFASQFEAIRCSKDYHSFILSLSICSVQDMHGGKSGAEFFITGDDRYLVKVISAREFEMFVTNAHTYFESGLSSFSQLQLHFQIRFP